MPFIWKLLWGHNLKIERSAFVEHLLLYRNGDRPKWSYTKIENFITDREFSWVQLQCEETNQKLCTKMIKRVRFVLTLFLHMFGDVNYSYRLFLLSVYLRVRIGIVWTKKNAVWLAFVLKIYIINNNNILLRSHTICCMHIFEKKKIICLLAILPIKILSHRKICRIYHNIAWPYLLLFAICFCTNNARPT